MTVYHAYMGLVQLTTKHLKKSEIEQKVLKFCCNPKKQCQPSVITSILHEIVDHYLTLGIVRTILSFGQARKMITLKMFWEDMMNEISER